MSQERKDIRQALVARLLAVASPPWGTRVRAARTIPLQAEASEFPQLLVYTADETATVFNQAPLTLKRALTVVVAVLEKDDDTGAGAPLQDRLDDLAKAVEDAVWQDRYLKHPTTREARTEGMVLQSVRHSEDDEGEFLIAVTRLEYQAVYYTEQPALTMPDFARARVEIDTGGPGVQDGGDIKDDFDMEIT